MSFVLPIVVAITLAKAGAAPAPAPAKAAEPKNDCPSVDEKMVQDELSPGFGTIIQKARLVPQVDDGKLVGFKIFAIDKNSLLGKTGLENNDVITQVNDTHMTDPSQGFALYQAFQDEKEVRIHVLRAGKPKTIVCRIKSSSK